MCTGSRVTTWAGPGSPSASSRRCRCGTASSHLMADLSAASQPPLSPGFVDVCAGRARNIVPKGSEVEGRELGDPASGPVAGRVPAGPVGDPPRLHDGARGPGAGHVFFSRPDADGHAGEEGGTEGGGLGDGGQLDRALG